MSKHFDIAVLGAGPGGYVAALKAAQMGATVAIVEQGHLGGTCLNVGCIPSKALLASAELLHSIRGASTMGVKVAGDVTFDWPTIQARKDKVLQTLRGGIKSLFGARKVTLFQGRAKLNGPGKVVVESKTGKRNSPPARSSSPRAPSRRGSPAGPPTPNASAPATNRSTGRPCPPAS